MKSRGVVRSQTRYHFVYGTGEVPGFAAPNAEVAGVAADEATEMEAGDGSGAPAKSAKSRNGEKRSVLAVES